MECLTHAAQVQPKRKLFRSCRFRRRSVEVNRELPRQRLRLRTFISTSCHICTSHLSVPRSHSLARLFPPPSSTLPFKTPHPEPSSAPASSRCYPSGLCASGWDLPSSSPQGSPLDHFRLPSTRGRGSKTAARQRRLIARCYTTVRISSTLFRDCGCWHWGETIQW